ncbi:MAG TPA: methyltransferase, FxLD system [Capsulimonadaceae bacterium]|nr:methyltransferase, FxLD system [Capsulimonadaceae bacterium]
MDERAKQLQQALADQLKAGGLLNDPSIEAAFRHVPRHLFLPDFELDRVYIDDAIGTKFQPDGRPISSSSQPAIMAIMLEQLDLARGRRVLEIGAGTGYNAALMAYIVGEEGCVLSVDIDEDIVASARAHLQTAGFGRVRVVQADGFRGLAEHAPFDRIILTVGTEDIASAWWEQLAPGGRLVVPLDLAGRNTMVSAAFVRAEDHLESVSLRACGFMMLRGEAANESGGVAIDGRPDLMIAPNEPERVDPKAVAVEMHKPVRDYATEVGALSWQLERDVRFWLAREGMKCFVLNRRRRAFAGLVDPNAIEESSLGVLREGALCTLILDRAGSDPNIAASVWVCCYGEASALAKDIVESLRGWRDAGCPSAECMRIRVYPKDAPNIPVDAEITLEKKSARLLLNWQGEG